MTRRRAARRPLERTSVAPRVIDRDLGRLAGRHVDVVEERDHRDRENKCTDRRDLVHPRHAVFFKVRAVTTRKSDDTGPVLDEEGHVETDKQQPEVDLSQTLVEHLSRPFGPPEVEPTEHGEHNGSEYDVVEVGYDKVGVRNGEVERRAGQDNAGKPTEGERNEEANPPKHRSLERD